jgi:hypothetical protein
MSISQYFYQPLIATASQKKKKLGWSKTVFCQLCMLHCKKMLAVLPSPAGMSLTKISLDGNNLNYSGQGEFGK